MTAPEHHSPVPAPARGFQGQSAGVVTRLLASGVDVVVVLLGLAAIYGALAGFSFLLSPRSFQWPERIGWSIPIVGLVVVIPYLALSWFSTGRTYGDALLGLRVVDRDGESLRLPHAALRAALCFFFPIGLLWVTISANNRSVQDIIVRTAVIYDWTPHTAVPPVSVT